MNLWPIMLWVTGIGTAALAITCIVLIVKRRNLEKKLILLVKYGLITLAPLTWGIGTCVADNDAAKDRAAAIMMLLLLLAVGAAFLGDIRQDLDKD